MSQGKARITIGSQKRDNKSLNDYQKSRQYCSCCNKFSRRFDLEHKEWICDLCEDERGV